MMKRVAVLEKLGSKPGTERQTAAFLALFLDSKVPWILDFTGVESLTPEFVEGFFGKAVELLGPELFQRRLSWIKLEAKSQRALHAYLQERIKSPCSGS